MNNANWFNDIEEKAYINAVFRNGKFIDVKTNKPIILKENARVKISTSVWKIKEDERKKHEKRLKLLFIKEGEELQFHFYYKNKKYEFRINLIQDLYYTKKGNQFSRLEPCKCIVTLSRAREKITAGSLNQAFLMASVKYRPENKSHNCNVFNTFYYKGRKLKDLRKL